VDGAVLVVEAENKRAEVAIQAKEHLEEAGAKVLGAVLNRRRHVIPEVVYRRL
jgi:Mrp family chromosome partitioning ATPase